MNRKVSVMKESAAGTSEDFGLESLWAVEVCAECGRPIILGEARGLCPSCRALPAPPAPARISAAETRRAGQAGQRDPRLRDVA